ncbi:protein kinase [bacterium]|nr:protein kinase [bacterium]
MSDLNPSASQEATDSAIVDPFLDAATRAGFIAPEKALQLQTEAFGLGMTTSRAALNQGVMNADQVDVVESLLNPKELVAGYEIVSLLGQGGMGVVYRARQLAFDRDVALKMIRVGQAKPSTLARFEHEAKTIGRFSHPHIVTAFDFGRTEGRLYLAMEYLKGQDADQFLKRQGPLPESIAWGLVRQTAIGLTYAAEQGVAHRDIKPANLLLIDPPQGMSFAAGLPFVKIADFGLALLTEGLDDHTRLTMENTTVGSPPYMAPEQLNGRGIDHRADIYALGATAYHLLCGQPPFQGLPLAQLLTQKLHGEPTPLRQLRPDLSEASYRAVESLMQRDVARRTPDYAQVIAVCDEILGLQSTALASTPPASETVSLPSLRTVSLPRSRWPYVIASGLLLLMLCLTSVFLFIPRTPSKAAGLRNWVPTGWATHCFDGRSLKDWKTIRGFWLPGQNDGEGGLVLAGRGVTSHRLSRDDGKPLSGFRLLALGQLHQADVLEIQFPAHQSPELAGICQLTPTQICWGLRRAATGPLDEVIAERSLTAPASTFHEFRFEWQGGEWLVYFDGELLAAQHIATWTSQEFRLAAESSQSSEDAAAWFSDVVLEELGPPRGNRPPTP